MSDVTYLGAGPRRVKKTMAALGVLALLKTPVLPWYHGLSWFRWVSHTTFS